MNMDRQPVVCQWRRLHISYTLPNTKQTLPLKLAKSSSLWWWSMANEMLFVFSHCASCSPTFTSSERVLRDAMVNNNRIVMTKLLMIIFKNLNILNFCPESVIVVCCKSSIAVCTDWVSSVMLNDSHLLDWKQTFTNAQQKIMLSLCQFWQLGFNYARKHQHNLRNLLIGIPFFDVLSCIIVST